MFMETRLSTGLIALCTGFALVRAAADTQQLHGEIKVCRRPGVYTLTDHQSVQIPVSDPSSFQNTYTGTCDKMGDNCRNIEVAVTRAGIVGPGWKSCAVLPAVLFQGDGHPLKAGQHLLPQWSLDGFEAVITVTKTFR